MTTNCTDSFQRANTGGHTTVSNVAGWSTSSDGKSWSMSTGADAPTYAIASNYATVTNSSNDRAVLLGSTNYADAEITAIVNSTSNNSGNNNGAVLRYQSATYMYFVVFAGAALKIYKRNGSAVDVEVASGAITAFAADTDYMLRFRAEGTALKARQWKIATQQEPSAWHVEATDADFATGLPGLMTSPNATGTVVKFKHFNCNDLMPPSGGIVRNKRRVLSR